MRKIFLTLAALATFLVLSSSFTDAGKKSWKPKEIRKANTGQAFGYLTQDEKDIIMYVNLARMYPDKFLKLELKECQILKKRGKMVRHSKNKRSLAKQLKGMKSLPALVVKRKLYASARCLAEEQAKTGHTGHARLRCRRRPFIECLQYGVDNGKDVAMSLLIDNDNKTLIHRNILLNSQYTSIGSCLRMHPKENSCAVIEVK